MKNSQIKCKMIGQVLDLDYLISEEFSDMQLLSLTDMHVLDSLVRGVQEMPLLEEMSPSGMLGVSPSGVSPTELVSVQLPPVKLLPAYVPKRGCKWPLPADVTTDDDGIVWSVPEWETPAYRAKGCEWPTPRGDTSDEDVSDSHSDKDASDSHSDDEEQVIVTPQVVAPLRTYGPPLVESPSGPRTPLLTKEDLEGEIPMPSLNLNASVVPTSMVPEATLAAEAPVLEGVQEQDVQNPVARVGVLSSTTTSAESTYKPVAKPKVVKIAAARPRSTKDAMPKVVAPKVVSPKVVPSKVASPKVVARKVEVAKDVVVKTAPRPRSRKKTGGKFTLGEYDSEDEILPMRRQTPPPAKKESNVRKLSPIKFARKYGGGCKCAETEVVVISAKELYTSKKRTFHHLSVFEESGGSQRIDKVVTAMCKGGWTVCNLKLAIPPSTMWADVDMITGVMESVRKLKTLDVSELQMSMAKKMKLLKEEFPESSLNAIHVDDALAELELAAWNEKVNTN